jgi:hypothetical protein
VLIALDVRLHVLRRHQPHLVSKRTQLACPVMGRRTRFQPDHTAWKAAEERQHLPAPQSLTQDRSTLRGNRASWYNVPGSRRSPGSLSAGSAAGGLRREAECCD